VRAEESARELGREWRRCGGGRGRRGLYRGQGKAGKAATGGNRLQLMALTPLMAEQGLGGGFNPGIQGPGVKD
jgi:hypothetical protein